MATADRSIDPRILTSAREEFLSLGFERASLKQICEKAGVTTGALYKRYSGKGALFAAVVAETLADLDAVMAEKCAVDPASLSDEALIKAWDMDEAYMLWWFHFLHERRDGFTLLIKCAEGTAYANFQHDWVEKLTGGAYGYYWEAQRRGLTEVDISESQLHILLSAFWTTIYEPFIHGFSWEEIKVHCRLVCGLFNWFAVLGFFPRP